MGPPAEPPSGGVGGLPSALPVFGAPGPAGVGSESSDSLGGESDANDGIRETFTGKLDGKPAIVARTQTGCDPHPVLRRSGHRDEQGAESIEDLARPFERAIDVRAKALGRLGATGVAKRRSHRRRVRDALEVAAKTWLVELEAERVGRDVLEPVRFVDDDVLGLWKERASHPRVLQQERVIDDDDAGVGGSLARALQVAVHSGTALASPLVTRLVVGRDPRPELALSPHQIQLGPISALRRCAPDQGLAHETRFFTRRDRAAVSTRSASSRAAAALPR